MVPSIRKKGELPLDNNNCIKLRCNHRACRAKALVNCMDMDLIAALDYKTLRGNPDLWKVFPCYEIPHTCNKPVPYYNSDKRNFGEDFRVYHAEYNNGTTCAWLMAQKDWTSGFGLAFDAVIQGLKSDHAKKIKIDRQKIASSNKKAETPHDLIVPKKCINMEMTTLSESLFPMKKYLPFFRKRDKYGNLYFMTQQDSILLYESDSYMMDATYAPVSGTKFFYQLFIITVRKEIICNSVRPTIMAVPVSFVFMVGCKTEHYNEVFKTIREIANGDINTAGVEPQVTLTPLFIHADAELATRTAALINFPHADFRLCMFHLLQSWRRRFVENKGFKGKIEPGADFDPIWREFWECLCGVPNTKVLDPEIMKESIKILENYFFILKFQNLIEKTGFNEFIIHLKNNYFSSNARFPIFQWEQYSSIMNGTNNRTNNASEANNSSLNRFFPKKVSFNNSIDRIHNWKSEKKFEMDMLLYQWNFSDFQPYHRLNHQLN